jgi:hypothetical protein
MAWRYPKVGISVNVLLLVNRGYPGLRIMESKLSTGCPAAPRRARRIAQPDYNCNNSVMQQN